MRSYSAEVSPTCANCGSGDMTRLISTFAVVRSEEDLMRGYDSMDWMFDLDPDDPQGLEKIKKWSETHGGENDSPFSPYNAYQNEIGEVGFGGMPPGIFDEQAHSQFHGLDDD